MRLLLRADAGVGIGAGHVSRCVAFAEEAVARGWAVDFSGRLAAAGWFAGRLDQLGAAVHPAVDDAGSLARLAGSCGARLVLVDHYGLPGDLRTAVRHTGALLVSMEDGGFGRRAADVVVDCGLDTTARPDDGSPTILIGPRYAPLRAAVRAARETRAERRRPAPDAAPEVVVVLGGTAAAAGGALRAVLVALRDTGRPMRLRAISAAPVGCPSWRPGQRVSVEPPGQDLPGLLTTADLAVSAAGVTLLELCCVGVPMALVRVADNQAVGYQAAVDRGIAAGLGAAADLVDDHTAATALLAGLLADDARRASPAAAAAGLVDGLGAARVLDVAAALPPAG